MDRDKAPFYSQGLAFECQRCSACCRYDPGFVFLSPDDLARLMKATGLNEDAFIKTYCRWVPWRGGLEVLSLREKFNNDCVFWEEGGCTVYKARPFQCKSYPFWVTIVLEEERWKDTAKDCPGIGKGRRHSAEQIEALLDRRGENAYITREVGTLA